MLSKFYPIDLSVTHLNFRQHLRTTTISLPRQNHHTLEANSLRLKLKARNLPLHIHDVLDFTRCENSILGNNAQGLDCEFHRIHPSDSIPHNNSRSRRRHDGSIPPPLLRLPIRREKVKAKTKVEAEAENRNPSPSTLCRRAKLEDSFAVSPPQSRSRFLLIVSRRHLVATLLFASFRLLSRGHFQQHLQSEGTVP